MRLIDLSHEINEDLPVFPGDCAVSFRTDEAGTSIVSTVTLNMHAGTHIDLPRHMGLDSKNMSDYPIEAFCGRGVCIDVRDNSQIGAAFVHEKSIAPNDIVLFYTGFSECFDSPRYFTEHPVLTDECARTLIEKRVKIVGLDTPSPDSQPYPIHRLLLSQGIFLLENLKNLRALNAAAPFDIYAIPLKIAAEASASRVFAVSRV